MSQNSPTDLFPFLDGPSGQPDKRSSPPSALEKAAFYDDALVAKLRSASEEDLNQAAFGIIRVNHQGRVTFYNEFEARFSGRSPEQTIGRNFFDEVAPCTRSRLFEGRFKNGVTKDKLDVTFSYTFTYRIRPTLVDVRLLKEKDDTVWILIRPKAGAEV